MQDNSWSTPTSQDTGYVHSSYSYSNTYVPVSGGLTTAPPLLSLSQPNTPRPEMHIPPANRIDTSSASSRLASTSPVAGQPDRRAHPPSFAETSNPYPTSPTRRRRAESSMLAFETGPTFSPTKQSLELWNMDQTNGYQIQMHVKMDRGFFRAEQDWTCYRRNYFQVSATFDVHGMNYVLQGAEVPCLVQSDRQLHQVDYFSIGVSARVSGADKKIDLIQHTPKRDKGPQIVPQPRMIRAGGNLHLAPVGSNHNIISFERMQFKTATANNGKRRAAQQYYEIVVDLFANTNSGLALRVATSTSAPLVVRGRSPGHYADYNNSRYRPPMTSGALPGPLTSDPAAAAMSAPPPGANPPPYMPTLVDDRYAAAAAAAAVAAGPHGGPSSHHPHPHQHHHHQDPRYAAPPGPSPPNFAYYQPHQSQSHTNAPPPPQTAHYPPIMDSPHAPSTPRPTASTDYLLAPQQDASASSSATHGADPQYEATYPYSDVGNGNIKSENYPTTSSLEQNTSLGAGRLSE
ncbi:hypothetical protein BC940DRAFT_271821 [Gongronella butleri]|nr:hypothetical protein BC940DRAFT_271821 [Gongronella butleri]